MAKPVKTVLRRHSKKGPKTITGLSLKGIRLARRKGQKLPRGVKVKGYHSGKPRAAASLRCELGAFRAKGGKTYSQSRKRAYLSPMTDAQYAALMPMIERFGSEEAVIRRWLDGNIPSKVIEKPKLLADRIIKKRFGLGQRIAEKGTKDKILENVSHAWTVEAVFERLTGQRFDKMSPGTYAREMEGLSVTHYKNGKAILRYRKKSFDITERLKKILAKKNK